MEKIIWLNGNLVDVTGMVKSGDGIIGNFYEGVRFYETKEGSVIFRLEDHIKRFFKSADMSNFKIPYSEEEIIRGITSLLKSKPFREGYIRIEGVVRYGGSIDVYANAENAPSYYELFTKNPSENGISAVLLQHDLTKEDKEKCQIKGSRGLYYAASARGFAAAMGFPTALILTKGGCITEACEANVFFVRDGELCTPDEEYPFLLGLTRDTIIYLKDHITLPLNIHSTLRKDGLLSVEEMFLTGTAINGIIPIRCIEDKYDNSKINLEIGQITRKVQELYYRCVHGELDVPPNWLTCLQH